MLYMLYIEVLYVLSICVIYKERSVTTRTKKIGLVFQKSIVKVVEKVFAVVLAFLSF